MTNTATPDTGKFDFGAAVEAFLNQNDPVPALNVLRKLNFKLPAIVNDGVEQAALDPSAGPDLATLARILADPRVQSEYSEDDVSETPQRIIDVVATNVSAKIIAAAMYEGKAMEFRSEWLDDDILQSVEASIEKQGEEEACQTLIMGSDDPASLIKAYVTWSTWFGPVFCSLAEAIAKSLADTKKE